MVDIRHRIVLSVLRKQRVLAGYEKLGAARISLAAGAASQLVVNAPTVVPAGSDDVETSQFRHAFAEKDVHAPARHVG
jgi:hypothetical protein